MAKVNFLTGQRSRNYENATLQLLEGIMVTKKDTFITVNV
jgi:hypothetical protein